MSLVIILLQLFFSSISSATLASISEQTGVSIDQVTAEFIIMEETHPWNQISHKSAQAKHKQIHLRPTRIPRKMQGIGSSRGFRFISMKVLIPYGVEKSTPFFCKLFFSLYVGFPVLVVPLSVFPPPSIGGQLPGTPKNNLSPNPLPI